MTGEVEVIAWRETLLSEIVSDPNLPPMAKVALEALRADKERLTAKVRELASLLDKAHGTPCEQIRHQQEVERLVKERDAAVRVAEMNATSGAFWAERGKQAEARAERAEASLAGRDAEIAKAVAEAYEDAAKVVDEHAAACRTNAEFWKTHKKPDRQEAFEAMAVECEDAATAIRAAISGGTNG